MTIVALVLSFLLSTQTPPSDLNAPPADAQRGEGGLVTQRLSKGTGTEHPQPGDTLRLRYRVWRSDGTLVTKVEAPMSALLAVDQMLPGWRTAAMQMVAGETQRAWVPSALGAGKIPEGKSFVIDTEIVEILRPPATPEDVGAPPSDAIVTKSGLAYKVLRPGSGDRKPTKRSTVTVHYSGWTTDGRLFDSSIPRGEPIESPLSDVIRGWTEGLQLMTVGEKTRFWIPARLAYGNEPGKPRGMLVFDVELIAIK